MTSLKAIADQIIVITGASSGIGRATALEAAQRGATVVLAARSEDDLKDVCDEINASGGKASYAVCDVSKTEDVERLAAQAVSDHGRIDSWVNNAGVGIYARLLDGDEEDERRLFDINFWGTVKGSRVAVKNMPSGGALINVGSVASDVTFPLQGMYCSSKHALKAFTDGLRIELAEFSIPISVTLIKPAAIDTPFPQHARNFMSREPKLPDPAYPASEVAHAILYACENSKRDIYVGGFGRVLTTMQKFMPGAMDWFSTQGAAASQMRQEPARRPKGSLENSGVGNKTDGEHPGYITSSSAYTRLTTKPILLWSLGGLAVAAAVAVRPRSRGYARLRR